MVHCPWRKKIKIPATISKTDDDVLRWVGYQVIYSN